MDGLRKSGSYKFIFKRIRKDLNFHVRLLILDEIKLIWNTSPVAYRVGITRMLTFVV